MALLDDIVTFFTGGNKQPAKTETPRRTTNRPTPSRPESFYRTPTPAARGEQRFTPPTLSRGGGRGGMVAMSAPRQSTPSPVPPAIDQSSFQDRLTKSPNNWGFAQVSPEERRVSEQTSKGYGRALGNPLAVNTSANAVYGDALEAVLSGRGDEPAARSRNVAAVSSPKDPTVSERIVPGARLFGLGSERGTKQLSQSEWNALSTDQQKAVMVNWALYQAAAKDRENANNGDKPDDLYKQTVSSMFGDKLDSSTYAPNVIKVLSDLGYKSDNVDLDDIIQGRTMASYTDIAGGANPNTERQALSGALSSQAFNSESVVGALQKGANLLDAVANDGSIGFREFLPQSPYANLAGQDFDDLAALGKNLSHRGFVERLQSDPALSAEVTAQIDEANSRFGPGVLSQYLLDMLRANQDTGAFLTEDEFRKTWLGE